LDTYNANSKIFKTLLEKYNDLYNNQHHKEMMQKKTDEIFNIIDRLRGLLKEYETTENSAILKTAMDLQINELYPEIRNMKLIQNQIQELIDHGEGKYSVFTYPVALDKIDHDFGEKPSVIKFHRE